MRGGLVCLTSPAPRLPPAGTGPSRGAKRCFAKSLPHPGGRGNYSAASGFFVSSINYFDLFNLTPAFELDAEALQPRYRELQRQFHPDRFAAEAADVQRAAVQKAADINTAFSTLRDPVLRARHLLALAGHALNIESSTVSDTDFLMAQMELREQLEEADDFSQLADLREEAEEWLASLGREFAIDHREQDWSEAADTVRKMQFMSRFIDEVSDREARMEDEDYERDDFEENDSGDDD